MNKVTILKVLGGLGILFLAPLGLVLVWGGLAWWGVTVLYKWLNNLGEEEDAGWF